MAYVPSLIGAAVNDVLSLFQIPGANLIAEAARSAVASYLCKRATEAREVLLEEFATANISSIELASEDELGGILFRYFNAIRDNTARLNFRLMAKVMVGLAQRDRLFADEFVQYANLIASLSREEVLVITTLHLTRLASGDDPRRADIHWQTAVADMVPKWFPSELYARAVATRAMRSGLMVTPDLAAAENYFTSSPLMDEIWELADFQDALRKEEYAS